MRDEAAIPDSRRGIREQYEGVLCVPGDGNERVSRSQGYKFGVLDVVPQLPMVRPTYPQASRSQFDCDLRCGRVKQGARPKVVLEHDSDVYAVCNFESINSTWKIVEWSNGKTRFQWA
jgi:hypothetical protein